jgi:hypothetical protein
MSLDMSNIKTWLNMKPDTLVLAVKLQQQSIDDDADITDGVYLQKSNQYLGWMKILNRIIRNDKLYEEGDEDSDLEDHFYIKDLEDLNKIRRALFYEVMEVDESARSATGGEQHSDDSDDE